MGLATARATGAAGEAAAGGRGVSGGGAAGEMGKARAAGGSSAGEALSVGFRLRVFFAASWSRRQSQRPATPGRVS